LRWADGAACPHLCPRGYCNSGDTIRRAFANITNAKPTASEWDLEALRCSLGLTLREAEILMWISPGKTNKEISMTFDTSPRTANKHLEHIFEKLGIVTQAATVTLLLQQSSGTLN